MYVYIYIYTHGPALQDDGPPGAGGVRRSGDRHGPHGFSALGVSPLAPEEAN